eukprot:scaffold132834_cov20-Prasinocladus_malaysianus.AAC.1
MTICKGNPGTAITPGCQTRRAALSVCPPWPAMPSRTSATKQASVNSTSRFTTGRSGGYDDAHLRARQVGQRFEQLCFQIGKVCPHT